MVERYSTRARTEQARDQFDENGSHQSILILINPFVLMGGPYVLIREREKRFVIHLASGHIQSEPKRRLARLELYIVPLHLHL